MSNVVDNVDHEVGASDAANTRYFHLQRSTLGSDRVRGRRQRGWQVRGSAASASAAVVALANCGLTVPAAPATATPFKNFRRSTLGPKFLRVIVCSFEDSA